MEGKVVRRHVVRAREPRCSSLWFLTAEWAMLWQSLCLTSLRETQSTGSIQTWVVSQSRHISQLRRASLVTLTKELICVNWSKAHIWARARVLCPEAGIERMPKNISPRYKKNYKRTNKRWGLCQCEKWGASNSACAWPLSFQHPVGPVALQSCTCAPRIQKIPRQKREKERKTVERGLGRKVGQDRLIGGVGDSNQAVESCICQIKMPTPVFEF